MLFRPAVPAALTAAQELMGGRFGEMSTLMNYMTQSFNFRGKTAARPFRRKTTWTNCARSPRG